MAALVKSNRDLGSEPNIVQARYELRRAIDRDDATAQAEWAREWGESALDQAERVGHGDGWDGPYGPSASLIRATTDAKDTFDSLRAILAAEKPDMALAKERVAQLGASLTKINDKLDIEE